VFMKVFNKGLKYDLTGPQMSAIDATGFANSLAIQRIYAKLRGFQKSGWEAWTRTRISRSRI
jgi:hypothetical protein